MSDLLGKFVWYDLHTVDTAAAIAFYTEVVGWKTQKWEGGDDWPYTMWAAGDDPIGGVVELSPPAKAAGAPPHWMAYIGTPDVDATVDKAKGLGGKVVVQPMDMPDVGRMAMLQDPQGAAFAVFTPDNDEPPAAETSGLGQFSWHELMTADPAGAWAFYTELFGWKETGSMDMGPEGLYQMYGQTEDSSLGGLMKKPDEVPASAWLYYAHVDDVEAAAERVKKNGGQVVNGPMEVPGGDKVAQCVDPQGGMFAIHSTKAE